MVLVATVMDSVALDAVSFPHGTRQCAGLWWGLRDAQHAEYLELDGFLLRGHPV